MAPAMRNEIQTAEPATSPAAPSSEKMPAPTMAPTPMNAAWRTPNEPSPRLGSGGAVARRRGHQPRVATRTALIVCRRFSAWSNTMLAGDSNTSLVTSMPVGHVGLAP